MPSAPRAEALASSLGRTVTSPQMNPGLSSFLPQTHVQSPTMSAPPVKCSLTPPARPAHSRPSPGTTPVPPPCSLRSCPDQKQGPRGAWNLGQPHHATQSPRSSVDLDRKPPSQGQPAAARWFPAAPQAQRLGHHFSVPSPQGSPLSS